jgi:hypothetical protein
MTSVLHGGPLGFVPVQHVPLPDAEHPGEQNAEHAGHHDVRVHHRVGVRAGVQGYQDALADPRGAADQFGDDVHDERHGDRDPQPGGDERRGARQDHHGEPAQAADPQHGGGVPGYRVQGPDAVADLDDKRPEDGERDKRELHPGRRPPQHETDREDGDHRDRLEELDHPDRAAVGEAVAADQRADGERGGDADGQADGPAFEGLPDRRPEHGRGGLVPERGGGRGHRGELISADHARRAQPLPEAERGGERREAQHVPGSLCHVCCLNSGVPAVTGQGSRSGTRPAARL